MDGQKIIFITLLVVGAALAFGLRAIYVSIQELHKTVHELTALRAEEVKGDK